MNVNTKKERLVALDVFRGLTIASMVLVNTPGSWSYIYPPLAHAKWHGFTPTDLVFPFFLFAIGVSMSFSFRKYSENKSGAVTKILKRTFLIIVIAYLLKWFPFTRINFETMRIMGVLHRIALTYCFAAFICYFLEYRKIVLISFGLLILYWPVLYFFGSGDPYSLQGNFVLTVDKLILGENHLWKGLGIPFDPEGLLSTLPAIVSVTFGFLAGKLIQQEANKSELLIKLFLYGNIFIFLALAWNIYFPINKSLWTSSYVMMSTGIALVITAFFIYSIDIKGYDKWVAPFQIIGKNPLALYVLSIVIVKVYVLIKTDSGNAYSWIYKTIFVPLAGNMNGSLLFAITHVLIILGIGWLLHKKDIIIKV